MIIETRLMMAEHDSHVGEEQLEQYSVGCLPALDVAQVEEHVLLCETCQEELARIDSLVQSVRRVSRQFPVESWKLWRLPRFVPALAAAVILVFAASVVLKLNNRDAVAPLAVALEATRGENVARVPARQPLLIQPGLEGLPQFSEYRLEIVDRFGRQVRLANLAARPGGAAGAIIPGVSPGVYFVRLYSPAGALLREYALEVRDPR